MVKLLYHIPSGDRIILNDKKIVLKNGIDAILKTVESEDAEAIIFFIKQVAVEARLIILRIPNNRKPFYKIITKKCRMIRGA